MNTPPLSFVPQLYKSENPWTSHGFTQCARCPRFTLNDRFCDYCLAAVRNRMARATTGMKPCAVQNCGNPTLNPDYCNRCQEEIDAYVHADRANAQFSSQAQIDCGVTAAKSGISELFSMVGIVAAIVFLLLV